MSFTDTPLTLNALAYDRDLVVRLKEATTVSVIIPARNEASTIGGVLDAVLHSANVETPFVDEVIVVDDHSSDDTPTIAEHHGAKVISLSETTGKGEAMRAGLEASFSSLVVFLDADVINTTTTFVPRLIQPLLEYEQIQLVKGYYQRPFLDMPTGGGRVNELAARPILSLLYPGLGEIRQPLAGETAGRRSTFERVGFVGSYGVEIALLIDVAKAFGVKALAQVDLEIRRHRNRPLEELRPMSVDVLRAARERYGVNLPEQ